MNIKWKKKCKFSKLWYKKRKNCLLHKRRYLIYDIWYKKCLKKYQCLKSIIRMTKFVYFLLSYFSKMSCFLQVLPSTDCSGDKGGGLGGSEAGGGWGWWGRDPNPHTTSDFEEVFVFWYVFWWPFCIVLYFDMYFHIVFWYLDFCLNFKLVVMISTLNEKLMRHQLWESVTQISIFS